MNSVGRKPGIMALRIKVMKRIRTQSIRHSNEPGDSRDVYRQQRMSLFRDLKQFRNNPKNGIGYDHHYDHHHHHGGSDESSDRPPHLDRYKSAVIFVPIRGPRRKSQ